jgi:hypothetical protein
MHNTKIGKGQQTVPQNQDGQEHGNVSCVGEGEKGERASEGETLEKKRSSRRGPSTESRIPSTDGGGSMKGR